MKYLALLRGINVGGNNIIKMADLKAAFEKMGFDNVLTFIQSGNVIFETDAKDAKKIVAKIESGLTKKFSYKSKIVLVSQKDLKIAVDKAPKGFGSKPDKFRYDILFLRPPLSAKEAVKLLPMKEGVDQSSAGKNVLYYWRLISKASQSRMSKIILLPIYKEITIRNWNTTTKLLSLIE